MTTPETRRRLYEYDELPAEVQARFIGGEDLSFELVDDGFDGDGRSEAFVPATVGGFLL